ncbi:LytTR family DNA-binding domain-containing protein [uncultured Chryseobacterium sp.]|uniref:LytR/AlgR family response regulator transcription factor n=1 Tax=uncultured Chryseobacterium sp. TaxID=259322 RepID=UPI00258934C1|nr:LytTR family DNA-binding domain-containing protein [uncultured Chryseobacterium sp.]
MNIVIIEDEKFLAEDLLKTILLHMPSAKISAVLNSVDDSIEYFSKIHNSDLIFADIKLGDGLSFDVFNNLPIEVPIIFCTAYNDYMLEAFETMGIDYILKPFSSDDVKKSLDKFNKLQRGIPNIGNLLESLQQNIQCSMPSLLIYSGDKIIPISGDEIAFFFIDSKTTYAFTFDQKSLPISQGLDVLEQKFNPFFFRTNRQFLINRKSISSASYYYHRKLIIATTVDYKEKIFVSKEKVSEFLNWLAKK